MSTVSTESVFEESVRLARERELAHDPSTAIGPVHRLSSGLHEVMLPSAVSLAQRVPVTRAVLLRWNAPRGNGPWLVIERGVEIHPNVLRVHGSYSGYPDVALISEAGVIVARATSEDAAYRDARRRRVGAHGSCAIDVARENDVEIVESDAPYGCLAGGAA